MDCSLRLAKFSLTERFPRPLPEMAPRSNPALGGCCPLRRGQHAALGPGTDEIGRVISP
jgi:hypothetical protein